MSWFAPHDPPPRTKASKRVWKSILVPLDGSELSRRAVVRARRILELPGVAVTLLRVIECGEDRANNLAYQMDARHREACKALADVRSDFGDRSQEVNADVRFGDPATEILREIAEGNHDLVLMSTYGRAGLGQALIGSVARRVLRSSPIPVLLFSPRSEEDRTPRRSDASEGTRLKSVLVALDGSERAEEIVPAAEKLARTLGSTLHLFRAISTGSKEGSDRIIANEYLWKWKGALASRGIVSEVNVRAGNDAEAAFALIEERGLDAIALCTRARSGLTRVMHGGMTQELLRGADVPILALCNLKNRLPIPASALEHRRVKVG